MGSTLILMVVFVFDLIAFALAAAAEQRRASATIQKDATYNFCVYESDIATGLGVGSFLFLMAAQLIIMFASKCLCCGRAMQPSRSRTCAILLFITSWLTFIIAEGCLLAGSVRNAYHTKYRTLISEHPPSCEMLRKGVFGAGAAFIVFTGVLSKFYYVSYTKANDAILPANRRDAGIRMGAFNT